MSETKQILENIIADFSEDKFVRFFREKSRQFLAREENYSRYNDNDFRNGSKFGEINFSDGDSLIICAFEVKKELSERSGKKSQYQKAKNILKNNRNFSAGIFIFYDPAGNFRFSLVYPESIGAHRQWNNFRRFTYFVSSDPAVTNKTFLQRIGDGDFLSLINIKEAFSVEKVTKKFFGEYKNLFEKLVVDLDKNHTFKNEAVKYNINTENFAKKLLGQIVFLCFLQKKRWLGASQDKSLKEGDENFLQNLFEKKYIKYDNFFNDILEHLFYGALNKKSDKAGTFYRDYFKCQIPFLNGGLFESEYEWEKTYICLDNKIFAQILEVFNQYNFTVDENSPIDQEIAIDPEMLGKVFENLLNENLRKGKGTYYTPREIVHYMCQESLINYLVASMSVSLSLRGSDSDRGNPAPTQEDIAAFIKHSGIEKENSQIPETISQNAKLIDEKLASIKAVDPACGSGAFLVGMLQEIIKARQMLQEFIGGQTSEYNLKKETIQNCIYGVDIDPGAIEIAKLRLWLSLVVDYELEEIEPLPNLDYKIMQGNSLLEELVLGDTSIKLFDSKANENAKMKNLFEEDKQADLFGESNKQQKFVENLIKLHKEYFKISDFEKKKEKKAEINKIEQELIEKSVKKEIEKIKIDSKNIGNYLAPGVGMTEKDTVKFQKNLFKQGQIMNVLNEFKKTGVKPFFLWRLYFADVFESGGFDVVIGNPPYISAVTMRRNKKIKEYFKTKYPLAIGAYDIYVLFLLRGVQLTNKYGSYSWIIPNKLLIADYAKKIKEYLIKNGLKYSIDVSTFNVFKSAGVYPIIIIGNKKSDKSDFKELFLEQYNYLESRKFKKIKKITKYKTFKDFEFKIQSGITGFQANSIKCHIRNHKTKNSIPFIVSGSVDRYYHLNRNVRYMGDKYEEAYIKYNEDVTDSKWKFWNDKKIIIAGMTKEIEASYSESPVALGVGIYGISDTKNFHPKFILSLLNSKYLTYYLLNNFKDKHLAGGYLAINKSVIEQLPLVDLSKEKQKPFINLVDQILKKKKDNPEADTGELEKTIDQLVYRLYNLTKDEIKIVESN